MVKIEENKCNGGCGACIDLCPVIAMSLINDVLTVNNELCNDCGICIKVCPIGVPYEVK